MTKNKSISVSEAGSLGGQAAADSMTAQERRDRASKAGHSFWDGKGDEERSRIMRERAKKRVRKPKKPD